MKLCLSFFLLPCLVPGVISLSGHVCPRERVENYVISYNQAFLCQERYTTACGQLDWRRCTRYRVQTCYTPNQKPATRYNTVDQCCPGWKNDGYGRCIVPVCQHSCLNGGSCFNTDGISKCQCPEEYDGERCQNPRNTWPAGYTVFVICCALVAIAIIACVVCLYHTYATRVSKPTRLVSAKSKHRRTGSHVYVRGVPRICASAPSAMQESVC